MTTAEIQEAPHSFCILLSDKSCYHESGGQVCTCATQASFPTLSNWSCRLFGCGHINLVRTFTLLSYSWSPQFLGLHNTPCCFPSQQTCWNNLRNILWQAHYHDSSTHPFFGKCRRHTMPYSAELFLGLDPDLERWSTWLTWLMLWTRNLTFWFKFLCVHRYRHTASNEHNQHWIIRMIKGALCAVGENNLNQKRKT